MLVAHEDAPFTGRSGVHRIRHVKRAREKMAARGRTVGRASSAKRLRRDERARHVELETLVAGLNWSRG